MTLNMTTYKDYFTTRHTGDCFPVSLCNLLLELDETRLAQQIYRTYETHPLTRPERGVSHYLVPHLVEELTRGRYGGVFYTSGLEHAERHISWQFAEDAHLLVPIVKRHIKKGLLREPHINNHLLADAAHLRYPSIGVVHAGGVNHAVVLVGHLGESVVETINNGVRSEINLSFSGLEGYLTLRRIRRR